jgi:hypothetical protein
VVAVSAAVAMVGVLAACDGGSSPDASSTTALPTQSRSDTPPAVAPSAAPSVTPSVVPSVTPSVVPAPRAAPSAAVTSLKPVPAGSPATLTSKVEVTIHNIRPLKVTAAGPGETAGPAVSFVVEVRNGSGAPVDLAAVAVTAAHGAAGTPAVPSSAKPSAPLSGKLAPGATGRGTYVFRLPAAAEGTVRIQVSAGFATAVAVFRG